jgi:chaperonin GroES
VSARAELLQLPTKIIFDDELLKAPNICDRFSGDELDTLGTWCYQGYYRDRMSRSHWERRMTAAMELAIQLQKLKNFPWPGCSSVAFPLITIGALQFSANSYSDVIQGDDVFRYKVVGDDKSGLAAKRANRVSRHMSWQVLEQDQGWEEQHDRLFINLAVIGTAFVKTYFDATLGYPVGEFVSAWDLVIDYFAKSLETAKRKTQRLSLSRNDIYERIHKGIFRDVQGEEWYNSIPTLPPDRGERDLRSGQAPIEPDADSPFQFLEQHRFLDLDHDGYAEPYTVTFEENSHCVCRVIPRVPGPEAVDHQSDFRRKAIVSIKAAEHYTKYPFIPNPDGGFYDLGFGILLGPLNESVSTIINQIIDNGTLHNLSGGFIGRGMKIRGGNYTMAPFELKRVDSTGDDIRKNLVLFEPHQPPDLLFKLLMVLIEYSNRIAGTTDTMVGENPGQNTPASTFQGMQERGMRVYSWIFKRIWRAMKGEARQRYQLNKKGLRTAQYFGQENALIQREDYGGDPDQIAPVVDPNLPSSVMRLQQAMFVAQRAMSVPGYDHEEVERSILRAAKVPNPGQLYVGIDKAKPLPNPKVTVEELKLKGKQLDIDAKKQEWANHLMEERRLNNAKIMQLEAQAYKLVKDAQGADVQNKLQALELAMNVLQMHSAALTERIGALGGDESQAANPAGGAGVGGMAAPDHDSGVPGDVSPGAGPASGTVGNGAGAPGA